MTRKPLKQSSIETIEKAKLILMDSLCDYSEDEYKELIMDLWTKGCKPLTLKEAKEIIKEYDEENSEG